jgi:hypothetical protein
VTDVSRGFEDWYQSVTAFDLDEYDWGELAAAERRWFHSFYDAEGAASAEVAQRALLGHRLELTNLAARAVLADLHRTTSLKPDVVVDEWMDSGIRIAIDESYTAPSVWEIGEPELLAEVADYFQEQLDQTLGCWPTCPRHDDGLHAEVRDGRAVWWCRRLEHSVAPIGSLGLGRQRRAQQKPKRR